MLFLVFYLSFCFSGGSVAFADELPVTFGSVQGTFDLVTPVGVRYPTSFGGFSVNSSGEFSPSLGPYAASRFDIGELENFPDIKFSGFNNSFSVPVSFQASGLDLTELLISWDFNPRLLAYRWFAFTSGIVNSPAFFDYVPLSYIVSGSLVVNFSDGSSKTISISNVSTDRLSFSAKKDNRTNEYLLSSEDFNLSAENAALLSEKSSLTSKSASLVSKNVDYTSRNAVNSSTSVSLSTKVAMLSTDSASLSAEGKASFSSGDSSASLSGSLSARSGSADIFSSGVTNSISASSTRGTGYISTPEGSVGSNGALNSRINSFSLSNVAFRMSSATLNYFSLNNISALVSIAVSSGDLFLSAATLSFIDGDFSFSKGSLYSTGNFFGQDGELSANAGEFGVSDASFSADDSEFSIAEQGVINSAPVTLDKASDDVHVIGFSFSGTLTCVRTKFDHPLDMSDLSFSLESGTNMSPIRFSNGVAILFYPYVTYGDKESILAHISATLDGIYYALRFDIPLTLRRLIIPTTEEVSDVIEDAVDDIKNNAGGLGDAVTSVENDFSQFMIALSSGKPGSLKIPAAEVNVNGQKYKLWEEFDVAPYFQLAPIKSIVSYVVPILEFFVASYVIYQLYYLWISLLSGNSYFSFLKSLRELNDEEGA